MPIACLNPWQTNGGEWSIRNLWRYSDWIERLVFVALALMLAYTFFVLIRFSRHHYLARRESHALEADSWPAFERRFVADLSRGLRTLKAITFSAPFLGLAGTSYGILAALSFGVAMEKNAFLRMISARISASLISAAAGILVAIPAILAHDFLQRRINTFGRECSVPVGMASHEEPTGPRPFRLAQTLPLKKRFSSLPPFALIAAPALASVVVLFMAFEPYETPTGLHVGLVPDRCVYDGDDRLIVLRLSDAGDLFINQTQEDWNILPEVLSKIYGSRAHRTLYLHADDGVLFQTVADAIDIVENANVEPHQAIHIGADKLDIRVRLVTPQAMNTSCVLEPVAIGSSQRLRSNRHFALTR
jgi:biopolymer transport protein ExbD